MLLYKVLLPSLSTLYSIPLWDYITIHFSLATMRGHLVCFLLGVIIKMPQRIFLYECPGTHVPEFPLAAFLRGTSGA